MDKIVPIGPASVEIVIDHSRFIAEAASAVSVEQARAFISSIKQKYPDATHHVPAFVIGHGNSLITHCHDDGEPQGTAGRPALTVLANSGLGNVVVVITRYFGGIKLGTGGLVRAYTSAVQEVLKVLPRGRIVSTETYTLVIAYPFYDRLKELLQERNAVVVDQEFGMDVTLAVRLLQEEAQGFTERVTDLTRGQVVIEKTGSDPEAVVPILD